jgi:bacteriocin biosynthesis cyclodehydratase domain-containing protein
MGRDVVAMIKKIIKSKLPKIKSGFSVFILNPNEVQIRSGRWFGDTYLFVDKEMSGKLAKFFLLLDKENDWNSLLKKINRRELNDFLALIRQLNDFDLLENKRENLNIWKKSNICIIGYGKVKKYIIGLLADINFKRVKNLEIKNETDICKEKLNSFIKECDLLVVATDFSSPYLYNLINDICLEKNKKWVIASIDGELGLITPVFIPYKTACYKCFELRLESNIIEGYKEYMKIKYANKILSKNDEIFILPVKIVADILTYRVITFLREGSDPFQENSLFINLKTLSMDINHTLKLPRCPACGKPSLKKPNEQLFLTISQLLEGEE